MADISPVASAVIPSLVRAGPQTETLGQQIQAQLTATDPTERKPEPAGPVPSAQRDARFSEERARARQETERREKQDAADRPHDKTGDTDRAERRRREERRSEAVKAAADRAKETRADKAERSRERVEQSIEPSSEAGRIAELRKGGPDDRDGAQMARAEAAQAEATRARAEASDAAQALADAAQEARDLASAAKHAQARAETERAAASGPEPAPDSAPEVAAGEEARSRFIEALQIVRSVGRPQAGARRDPLDTAA